MVQSPSWEANWFAASQVIPRISRNPKVHYRTHKCPPPVSILGQPNQVHIPTSHLLEIRPNIIHPSTPRSPQWSPSLRLPIKLPLLTILHKTHLHDYYSCLPLYNGKYAWFLLAWEVRENSVFSIKCLNFKINDATKFSSKTPNCAVNYLPSRES